jgi:signal transduction histidine kinase
MRSSTIVAGGPTRAEAVDRYRSAVADVPDVLELVADVCQAPMAALKVAGDTAAHFAATLGMPIAIDVPQSLSLCRMVSAADEAMVVDDALNDLRVATHPLVAGANVRFLAAAPLHHEGHIVGALCVFDTERRRMDATTTGRFLERIARRIDAETRLRHLFDEQSRRPFPAMVDQDEVATTISHEIRTPLAAIRGHLEMLAETPGAIAPQFDRSVESIVRNADRLCRTVDTLLRAADQQRTAPAGERRPIDLAEVAAMVTAGHDSVRLDAPAEAVHVIADPHLLAVALGHLLRNALVFGRSEHPVQVTVFDGRRPAIEIRDHGPGLDATELARLGLPFFRGEVARRDEMPGLGLGLTVVHQILEAQGAVLRLDGAPGAGLTARVEF